MTRIVLIGAGSVQFGYGTLGEIFQSDTLKGTEVVLLDINPDALKLVEDTAKNFIAEHNIDVILSATTDRKEALKGASFVIISIEVGNRFHLWDQDLQIPQQFGIKQVYGENGGPGGLFHSLRIIPPILDICRDIQAICPKAYIFNYSNPMSRICTTVHYAFPDLQFVGLCHEIAKPEWKIPAMLGIEQDEIELMAAGLNHFSCVLEVRYKKDGRDAYPDVRKKAHEYLSRLPGSSDYLEHIMTTGELVDTEGSRDLDKHPVKATREWTEAWLMRYMLENFDLLPITTDSHFGEYIQWAHDVVDHKGIVDFYFYYKQHLCAAHAKLELKLKERVVPMMEALLGAESYVESAVNIPNKGFISELPNTLAVEVPATISSTGITGMQIPALPKAYAGLLQNQIAVHEMTAEAVLKKSKKAVLQALLVDPVVDKAHCLPEMIDTMISLQRNFLGYLE